MDIALYIVAIIALLVFIWFLIETLKSIKKAAGVLTRTEADINAVKRDIDIMTADFTSLKNHLLPAIDNVVEIVDTISEVTNGLKPRVDAIYSTVDDALDVAHGVLEDVERIKSGIVDTIEKPIFALRSTSHGMLSTILKGVNVVRDLVSEFKRR